MKHRAENSKIDALTRTLNIVAVKKEIAKYGKADATQDTLFLLHHHFTKMAFTKVKEDLRLCGFLLHAAFPYPTCIARVGNATFFLYHPGYLDKEQVLSKLQYYEHLLNKNQIYKDMQVTCGVCYTDSKSSFEEMLEKAEGSMRYARAHDLHLYIGEVSERYEDTKPYPHEITPFKISQKDVDAFFIFQMLEILYQNDTMQKGIDQVIDHICAYFKVHHVYIMTRDDRNREFHISHEHILKKSLVMNDNLKKMSSFIGERYQEVFDENGMIVCNRMEELKQYDVFMEERQRLRGVHSLMQHMLVEHGAYIGYLTLLDLENVRMWTSQQMATFHYLSHILSMALQQERLEKESEALSQYDHLTDAWKLDRFKQQVTEDLQVYGEAMALLTLDIKNFKMINTDYGYTYGNRILVAMAQILRQIMESHESFVRMNADIFVVLLHYESQAELQQRIEDIIRRMERMADTQNLAFPIICMIGVYMIKEKNMPLPSMIDHANSARKKIKMYHKSSYAFFDDADEASHRKEHHFIQDIIAAFHNNEFIVYYQPKVHIPTRRCYGLEALIRWKRGNEIIGPDTFISLFEKHGYIDELDMFVLKQACMQINTCIDAGIEPLSIAVNISGVHLRDPDIVNKIVNVCQYFDIPRNLIELEITESVMLEDIDDVMKKAIALKQAGFKLSMDDFGTGFSSLSILKKLPVDIIKLDREFFQKVMDQREKIIISNVIHMAQQLNINVISEGIETIEHIRFLQEIGCEEAQGFYFSKPLPMEELDNILWTPFEMEEL